MVCKLRAGGREEYREFDIRSRAGSHSWSSRRTRELVARRSANQRCLAGESLPAIWPSRSSPSKMEPRIQKRPPASASWYSASSQNGRRGMRSDSNRKNASASSFNICERNKRWSIREGPAG